MFHLVLVGQILLMKYTITFSSQVIITVPSTFWFYITLQVVVCPTTNEEQDYSAARLAELGWENAGTIARTQQPVSTGQFLHCYLALCTRLPTTTHYRYTLFPQVNTSHLISVAIPSVTASTVKQFNTIQILIKQWTKHFPFLKYRWGLRSRR